MDVTFDLDQAINRRGTDSYKWDGNERLFGRADLLPFWVADMDFATPQPILEAIRDRTAHPVLGYGFRSDEYFSAIQDWLKGRHQWDVPREWLMFCPPSSIVGIQGMVEVLSDPGDSIIAPTPTYGPLMGVVIEAVDPGGEYLDQDMAGLGLGRRDVLVLQDIEVAELVHHGCFHGSFLLLSG